MSTTFSGGDCLVRIAAGLGNFEFRASESKDVGLDRWTSVRSTEALP